MNEDKFLKDLLSDYHPQLSDDVAFMQRLQRQMELIEEVKAYQRAESRKNKLMSLKLLAVGIVLGCIVTLASFTLPTIFDRYINGTESEFILTLLHNVQYIGLAIGAGFVTLSLLFTTKLVNLKDETPLQ
ncbi:MAG: PTS cellobiose transporter subunit IIC [Prevotella sp.]|nr:PTS cellobiose transporter subunit IIC [Prevotella sp.]